MASDNKINYAVKKFSMNAQKFEGEKTPKDFKVKNKIDVLDYQIITDWNPKIYYRGMLYNDRKHAETALITIRDLEVWQKSRKTSEIEHPKLPKNNDNNERLIELMKE